MSEPTSTLKSARFVSFIIRRPGVAFLLGVGIPLLMAVGAKGIVPNFTHTAFFQETDPMLQAFNRFEKQFGNDDSLVLVMHSPSGIFDLDSATLLADVTEKMWSLPYTLRVDSLANYSWVHSEEDDLFVDPFFPEESELTDSLLKQRKKIALSHEVLPDYLVSQDGKTALLYARMRPGFETPPDSGEIVAAAEKLIKDVARTDHQFFLNGGPVITHAFQQSAQHDFQRLVPLVLLMAIVFLALMLRSIGGVFLPFVVMAVSISAAMGLGGWIGIELNVITIVLPQLLIAVSIADSVHILSGFCQARRRGTEKLDAVRHTLSKNFLPTILTSISTAVGFFAFSTSGLKPVLGLGVLAGFGTIVAWFASYMVMGPLLVWLPSWVKAKGGTEPLTESAPFAKKYTRALCNYCWPIVIVVGIVSISSGALGIQNTVNSDPYKYFAEDYPLRKSHEFILEHLKGLAAFEMSIEAGEEDGIKDPDFLRRVDTFADKLRELNGVTKAISILDVFKQTNRSLHGDNQEFYVLPDSRELVAQEFLMYTMSLPQGMDVNDRVTVGNDALRMTLVSKITNSSVWVETSARVEKMGEELGLDVRVTGKTRLYQDMNGYVTRSFIQSLLVALVLISIILVIAFRSLGLGLFAMIPNIIPLLVGAAALKLLGHTLDIGTVLVCSVCLGIAVDDTIHMLASFRRYQTAGLTSEESVSMTLTHTGPALLVTTLVLVGAFGTLGFGTFMPNVYFGIMCAIVLTVALIVDLSFLPALLARMGKKASTETTP